MQGSLEVVILSVRGWRPDVRIGDGANNADYIIPYNTMATVQVSATEFFPNTSAPDGVRIFQYEWVLPAGMSSPFGQGTFLAGNTIYITPTSACVSIDGVLRVRARNFNCGLGNEHNGAFRDITIRRNRPALTLTASHQTVPWGTQTPVRFTVGSIPGAERYEWEVVSGFTVSGIQSQGHSPIDLVHAGCENGIVRVWAMCGGNRIAHEEITVYVTGATASSISGPATICVTGTFTVVNTNFSVTSWSVTPGFIIDNSDTFSATVRAASLNGQTGTLTAKVSGCPITKEVQACDITGVVISGPAVILGNAEEVFQIRNLLSIPNARIRWTGNENIQILGGLNQSTVRVRRANTVSCGSGWLTATIEIPGSSPITLYKSFTVGPVLSSFGRLCGNATVEFDVVGIPSHFCPNHTLIEWESSNNITILPPLSTQSHTSRNVRRTSSTQNQGPGWVRATINIPGELRTTVTKNIADCAPPPPPLRPLTLSGPTALVGFTEAEYEIRGIPYNPNTRIYWTSSPNIRIVGPRKRKQATTIRVRSFSPTHEQESGWVSATVHVPGYLPSVTTINVNVSPTVISGPVRLCGSSFGEFEIMGIPFGSNAQVHWTTSPNIKIVLIKSANYHRIRTKRGSPTFPQESGWVKATVQMPGLQGIVLIQDIENCPPPPEIIPTLNISGPTQLCGSIIGDYQLLTHPYVPNTQVRWSSSWGIQILNPQEQTLTNRARRTSPTQNQGAGWIAATVDVPGMDIQTIFLNITTCPPPPTLSISGPTQFCGHTIGEFEVMGIPLGSNTQVHWTTSPNIEIVLIKSVHNHSIRARRVSPTHDQGAGWVRATVEIPGFQPIVVTRNIVVCPPPLPVLSISGPSQLCGNTVQEYEVIGIPFGSNARVHWSSSSCIELLFLLKKKHAVTMRATRFPIRFPQTAGSITATVEIPGLQPIVVTKNIVACAPSPPNLSISGPTQLCGHTIGQYEVMGIPSSFNAQVNWTSSNNIMILDPEKQTAINRAMRSHDQGSGWVRATVEIPGLQPVVVTKNVAACPPPPTLSISGPTTLCGHTIGEFEVMGAGTNVPITWASSANIRRAFPKKKNPRVLRAIRTFPTHDQGAGWVRAFVHIPGFQPIVVTKNIAACASPPPPVTPTLSISGPTRLCGHAIEEFEVRMTPFIPNTRVYWGSSRNIRLMAPGKHYLSNIATRASPTSGQESGWIEATVMVPGFDNIILTKQIMDCPGLWRFDIPEFSMLFENIIVFPNPADNTLVIDLTQQTEADLLDVRTTSDVIYDIRLFNAQGFIVRRQQARTGRVEFDVSNLPEGTYYLHIDRNNEIEKIQIIVRRQ